jgi:hypothetical protein
MMERIRGLVELSVVTVSVGIGSGVGARETIDSACAPGRNLSILTIHGGLEFLYIPAMLAIRDPDTDPSPNGGEVPSIFPQSLVRVLLRRHVPNLTCPF